MVCGLELAHDEGRFRRVFPKFLASIAKYLYCFLPFSPFGIRGGGIDQVRMTLNQFGESGFSARLAYSANNSASDFACIHL